MQDSDVPAKFAEIWGKLAVPPYIRVIPKTAGTPNDASLDLGFPPNTAVPVASGGVPPNIADFNGILSQLSAWALWHAAAGPIFYDGTFSGNIGGYPKGTILSKAAGPTGNYWLSTADNNASDPDTGGGNWTAFTLIGLAPLNSPTFTGTPTAPTPTAGDNTTKIATTAFIHTALAGYVAATRRVDTINGLIGGGALSSDLTLQPDYGTTAGTVMEGNDVRVVAASILPVAAFVHFLSGGSIVESHGVTSVTKTGTGVYDIVLAGGITMIAGYADGLACPTSPHQEVTIQAPNTVMVAGGTYTFKFWNPSPEGPEDPARCLLKFY